MSVSTEEPAASAGPASNTGPDGPISAFDAARPYELHPAVEVRPEPFGALLYSFKTRRLSFLKDPLLVTLVRALGHHPTAGDACRAVGITDPDRRTMFLRALATLASTETIRERHVSSAESSS
ncbi:MAG: mycofactocin biosynthesis chaperone MftB [Nakamurella sp.]